ncbi:hypothetical protein PUN4_50040 [Paraburkholderia unamae]|nr:hypothetical protein PUN4_50040 [Paraburkholderia unamae]
MQARLLVPRFEDGATALKSTICANARQALREAARRGLRQGAWHAPDGCAGKVSQIRDGLGACARRHRQAHVKRP